MGQNLDKFLLLMWKNWVLQYRRPIQTIVEILVPVIFSVILVLFRSLVDPEPHDAVTYNPFCTLPLNLPGVCDLESQNITSSAFRKAISKRLGFPYAEENVDPMDYFQNFNLIYSPNSDAVDEVMSLFKLIFGDVVGLNSSAAIDKYYTLHGSNSTFAAIQFDDSLIDRIDLGPDNNVKVAIRFPSELRFGGDETSLQNTWLTNLIFPAFQTAGPRNPDSQTGANPSYFKEGFLALQHLLSIFITWRNADSVEFPVVDKTNASTGLPAFLEANPIPFISLRRFPFASWQSDILLTPLKGFVSIIIMLSFVYTCINTVKTITYEKEKQLKEAMKIMGLPNWLHWTAWFLKTFSYLMVSIILVVVLLKVRWYTNTDFTVFTYANPFVLVIFLFFYVCATITFCFAISVFVSKANTAATIAGLLWFLSYAPYSFTQQNYDNLSLMAKLATSLGANAAMSYGFQIIIMYEGSGEGVQFNNIWKPNSVDDNLSLGIVMIMLVVDCLLYLCIALYFEAIFPGEYGVPQKWNFPFTKTFWCGIPKYTEVEDFSNSNANVGEYYESEPKNLPIGVKIRNLKKSFGGKAAVRNLSLNMFQDQITVLLGHNGAGKTTTMSMLTGMFPPTGGTAVVGGYDIRSDMEGVRNSLGLCPQHNIIFDDLTVAEHLYFFSRLKGLRGKAIDAEITKYVNLLELEPKRNARSSTLSGGMKRKLCVGMALCGNSKVVMLDEPTAGMDPSARRALWDLMLRQKTGRTVLLTTHFMDEADLLGDRIAIMAGGELQCCGSSFFLKKKYGAGYHLIMDKSIKCIPENVTALLRRHIPNIEVHGNVGSELSYLLAESQSYVFEVMLRDLEQHSIELGINSYGISLTTLEEVFMKVGADHGQEEMYNGKPLSKEINGNNPVPPTPVSFAAKSMSSVQLSINQVMAMSMKKILSTLRSWILLLIQILLPVIFLIIVIVVSKTQGRGQNLPSMPLELSKYSSPVVLTDGVTIGADYAIKYKDITGGAYREVASIPDEMMKLTAETPATVKRSYIAGASFDRLNPLLSRFFDMNFTAYFNNDPYHTPGVALGLAANAMYRKIVVCEKCGIEFSNYPLVYSTETQITQLQNGNNLGFQFAFNVGFSMAFVSSFYILFIVRERISKSKHLQFVSGVKVFIFWMITWFWDFVTYIITIIALLVTLVCFQEDGFKSAAEIGRLFLVFLYFGWFMLPMIYLAGFMFDVPSTGYTRMTMFSIFTGNAVFLVVQVLTSPGLDLEYVGNALHWVFLALPHYSMATGIRDMYQTYYYNNMCNTFYDVCWQQCPSCTKDECFDMTPIVKSYCEDVDENYLKWASPGIGRNLIFSFTGGAILLVALLIVEYKVFSKIAYIIRQKYFAKHPTEVPDEDGDVQAEKHKIRNIPEAELVQNYTMVLKDLSKYYKKFLAVNGLSLGIKKYECFGLLGINGAGKTTTFKMLTGDVSISHGDAWVNGRSIKREIKEVQKAIGYCPQFDALLDDLTARETLTMFALLRGIPLNSCNRIAVKLAADFDYERHLDKKVKELSGGNKRKLSTSIALIGDPPVMYLDEPTTGMDPSTKRYLWNALCKVRDSGKTIVLTSHSMEECEALCTRLAIMVNGNFKCLGSTQHLKNKFAQGYTITIKVRKPENSSADQHSATDKLEQFMLENFSGSQLREKHEELLTYYVTDKSVPWSKMFGILEEAKRRDLNIEDYSLGQSSLEQVFLTFTKHQIDVE